MDHKKYAINLWKSKHPGCAIREIDGNVYGFIWGYTEDFFVFRYNRAFPIYMEHPVPKGYLNELYNKHFNIMTPRQVQLKLLEAFKKDFNRRAVYHKCAEYARKYDILFRDIYTSEFRAECDNAVKDIEPKGSLFASMWPY